MAELGGAVQQQGYSLAAEGTTRTGAMNRSGALVVSTPQAMYDQWLRAGKVFEAHFATEGGTATIESNASIDLTEPFFRMTVPSSKILVPIRVFVTTSAVWVTADGILMGTSEGDTYNTGGAAPDVRNLGVVSGSDSALGTTACTNIFDGDSVLTENALVNPRILHGQFFRTGGLFVPFEYNILKGDPMAMIHGSSSFWIAAQLTGALEAWYSVVWAELDKNELVNS